MVSRQLGWLRYIATSAVVAALTFSSAGAASAQEPREGSSPGIGGIVKGVFLDPTTYAPAVISYDATMRDWNTSQPFFENGWVERNARFTQTGRSNDWPVSYTVGRNQIVKDTLATFGVSVVQNTTSRIVEHALISKYPEHRKLVKAIGWVQRIGVASLMSYQLSAPHYRQAGLNAQRARELGF